ncbi:hypothetical protein quinque_015826 [Culex quinquefasciatus]
MPTQKKKAKHQEAVKPSAATVPTAVQIKSEPLDIKPLSAFVDDRVELIRQAFMCLKPKEITCLAPDGLQGKSIEFIQEQCLDEVLGISTKRLLSIINSTQCPTDTDSSDDEEEQTVEHISLDEISSDSEVEVKPQVKSKKAAKKLKGADGKKTGTSTAAASKNGDKKSEKEMTVLELLELQARARAIRSITGPRTADAAKPSSKSSKTTLPAKNQPKRVRLKRNFRVRQVGDEEPPEEDGEQQAAEQVQKSVSRRESRSKSKEKVAEAKPSEETKEESAKSRDSSPEVIPVIPSPETLCISSDSEEEKERKRKASIFVDNIEELDRQAKEKAKQLEAKKAQEENDDTEEGRDIGGERSRKESIGSVKASEEKKDSPRKDAKLDNEEELDYDEVKELSDSEPDTSVPAIQPDKQPEPKATSADEKASDSSDSEAESSSDSSSEGEPEVVKQQPNKKKQADEIEDDDEDDDPDIVEIHDSDDETLLDQKLAEEEDEPEKSWGSRWLESNRVAKVMAASRLGNKVRDKLKKKKKKQKQDEEDAVAAAAAEAVRQAEEKEAEAKAAEEQQPVSTAEVGSVEHYNELFDKKPCRDGSPVELFKYG